MNLKRLVAQGGYLLVGMLIVLPFASACISPALPSQSGTSKVEPTQVAPLATATPKVVPPATPTVKTVPSLTETALKNGKYNLPDVGPFQLEEGKYERKGIQGSTTGWTVGLTTAALGDLDGDGVGDAAVILRLNTGGSGTFVNLVGVINREGTPQQTGIQSLGDRVKVESLTIREGKIAAALVVHGPQDPLCCPTQKVTRTYQLAGNALKLVSTSN